jgi:hypothetical protein
MDNNLDIIILLSYGMLFTLTGLYFNNNINKNDNKNEYNKMYKIIELASGLDKDRYNRKISPNVVKKFCKIAKKYSIDLDIITDEQFNFIYIKYTEYLIKKYDNN